MHKITKNYIIFLSLIAAVPSLSTDMYLAAIPQIAKVWDTPISVINYSLTFWFIAFSISLLIAGSLSDKYGRRPILLFGMTGFVISSFLCANSANITQLIIFRILQGISAAFPSSMAMAVCRDKFTGSKRKIALAYIGIILALTPMLSPSFGSIILYFAEWEYIFITQGLIGFCTLFLCLRFTETNKHKSSGNLLSLFKRYPVLFKNKAYIKAVIILSFTVGPFLGFVAYAPYVYITIYKLSNFNFSILFATNAMCSMAGAYIFTRLHNRISDNRIITISLLFGTIAGLGVIATGSINQYFLLFFVCCYTFFFGISRPVTNNLILSLVNTDIGSASSFIICYQFIIGAICMSYTTHEWQHSILMFGILEFAVAGIALVLWIRNSKDITAV